MAKRKREPKDDDLQSNKPNRSPTAFEERLYQALRRNPFAPMVPCHRVVAADLSIGGFSGAWGIADPKVQRKKRLLEDEGVKFVGCTVLSDEYVLNAEQLRQRLSEALAAESGGGSKAWKAQGGA
ncbi:hypothetical protein VOLCADRAFT_103991 [Volvox carteri f. nagariensis]|uniref:Methylated-DNA--protein-cysteine methyltransferase n=1 Tax=Volvox carteri f. nagariensis TaxID=3068 RepID=D8TQI7_VOLCA|nr:uncharacterized protein VOLCADRAFT_103991 [Volvox carteri f. nagariensis]EFJ50160.1 hypothetical protein VOLCADRAFT_103991 [Volvox carteri f. nagariensis]|eukprot:XP_002948780.1 hypothetical protein VOLCADRAFT_103991 [Volvox carteri f. nagariensis]